MAAKSEPDQQQKPATPAWEKTIGLSGFLLLCLSIGYLTWTGLTEKQTPPQIDFTVKEIQPVGATFHVQVEVSNQGSQSLSDLFVRGELKRKNGPPEQVHARVDYVPSHSKREIGLFFVADPRIGTLKLSALGYQKP